MARARVVLSPTLTMVGERPVSRSAGWGRSLGAFSLLFALVAFMFHSFGAADTPSFLHALALSLAGATLAILLSARGFSIIWARGKGGLGDAMLGLFYGLLLWAVPLGALLVASQYPLTADVTTQTDAPQFLKVQGVRPAWANPVEPGTATPSPLSRALLTDASMDEVYDLALSLVLENDWDIVDEREPAPKNNPRFAGLQATETSFTGFVDDIMIQFSLEDKQTRVDMRSASRIGSFDLGRNTARIDAFMVALRQKLNER